MKYLVFILTICLIGACQHLPKYESLELGIKLTGAPTYEEANAWRENANYQAKADGSFEAAPKVSKSDEVYPTLINGTRINPSDYPFVVVIKGCTGSLIGPQVLSTAAHCVSNGGTQSFRWLDGKTYYAKCTHSPEYKSGDQDLALCKISQRVPIKNPVPLVLERTARVNMKLHLFGAGCTTPGGKDGNFGTLRRGETLIKSGQKFDLVSHNKPNGAALCFGDSGGPGFIGNPNDPNSLRVISQHSKGNIRDTNYTTRWDRWAKDWVASWSSANGVGICGHNLKCREDDGGGDPPPPPSPKSFSFENELVKIEGIVK